MKIKQNYNLSKLNTFGIEAKAKFFTEIHKEVDIEKLFYSEEFKDNQKLFLGGGSNVLFTKDFDGIVVLNTLKGIEIKSEDSKGIIIKAMGGEIWHDLVVFAVEHGYWGIENLSFIPGTVGAAPMQNIEAYGAELASVLESVETYEIETGEKRIFSSEECELGYRDSIFKNKFKGKYFIFAITLRLSKVEQKNISYRSLIEYFEKNKIEINNSKDISNAVTAIRKSVLPNPSIIPNAGSFFKNVFLSKEKDNEKIQEMLSAYPDMPYFENKGTLKIPTAWLVEQAGWKGKRVGSVGVHAKHALVLVNYGGANGEDIKELAAWIEASVLSKFGLNITPEVNLI